MKRTTALVLLAAALMLGGSVRPSFAAEPSAGLIANGGFETDRDGDGWPDGWPRNPDVRWETENSNRFLRLRQTESGRMLLLYHAVPVPAQTKQLTLRFRVRYADVQSGKEVWNDARFIFHFKDAGRKELKPDPQPLAFRGSSDGWTDQTVRFAVPAGATLLEIMPALFQARSGTLDIDDVRLEPENAAQSVPAAAAVLAELRVAGNRIKTAGGKTIWLQGVNVPSLEWMPEGEHVLDSIRAAVEDWKSGVIRLPVNDEYWFGRGPRQSDGGAAYRALVDACVRAAAGRGAYIVLDLHKYRAPQPGHIVFWKAAATAYKNNPAVLFDIINEPHDISWKVWRDGGTVEEKPKQGDTPAVTVESPGMQKMVDVIRATGARNIIVAGGLDWAYDLTGVLGGYALNDRGGNGIVYSSHVYPWKRDWAGKVLAVAAKHPVLLGEVGCDLRKVGDNPNENPYTWAPDMLGFIQKHELHWTAWSFHTDATPRVLADWEYNPTPFWGAWVRAALLGAKFGLNRMR